MGRINSRSKGASGEHEACRWWQRIFNTKELNLTRKIERNLEQSRDGGKDLIDCHPFCVEVKRCERLELAKWWNQVSKATSEKYHIPVVMYRQNRKEWRFLISAQNIGVEKGFLDMDLHVFKKWALTHLYNHWRNEKNFKQVESITHLPVL